MNRYRKGTKKVGDKFQEDAEKILVKLLGWHIYCFKTKKKQFKIGENEAGVEFKCDEKYLETGNIWIEYAEKAYQRGGPYALGGILKNDNSWLYIIGHTKKRIFCFTINQLRQIYEDNIKKEKYEWKENGLKTSLGFLMPEEDARKIAIWYLRKLYNGTWKRINTKKKSLKIYEQ